MSCCSNVSCRVLGCAVWSSGANQQLVNKLVESEAFTQIAKSLQALRASSEALPSLGAAFGQEIAV